MGISKTTDYIQIKIKMANPSQDPPASSKAPNQDSKDMDVICAFKIKIEQKFETWVDQTTVTISRLRSITQQEPLVPSKALNLDFQGHGCSLHLQNQGGYKRPITIARSRPHTPVRNPPESSISPKSRLTGHHVFLYLKN